MIRYWPIPLLILGISCSLRQPVPIIYDTDVGNDVDDALALAMLHTYSDRGRAQLLCVTVSKDNEWSAPFVDAVNTFYGRPDIPIGVVRDGETPEAGKFIQAVAAAAREGEPLFPHDLKSGKDATEAVELLRRTLAVQADGSTIFVVVGFSTNLARLLDSPADEHSPLGGKDLVARKVKLLSIMAGMYSEDRHKEYNVYTDVEAARKVYRDWPTPIVASGFEIGRAIRYPARSIEADFRHVEYHPIPMAYRLYKEMPYDRECWDLTSVLHAVEPDTGHFDLSPPGTITVDEESITRFAEDAEGRHRYLLLPPGQAEKVRTRLVDLVTAKPGG